MLNVTIFIVKLSAVLKCPYTQLTMLSIVILNVYKAEYNHCYCAAENQYAECH